jgi:hypothetical protein
MQRQEVIATEGAVSPRCNASKHEQNVGAKLTHRVLSVPFTPDYCVRNCVPNCYCNRAFCSLLVA